MLNKRNLILTTILLVAATLSVSAFVLARSDYHSPITASTAADRLTAAEIPAVPKIKVTAAQPAASPAQLLGAAAVVRFTLYEDGIWPTVAHVSAGLVAIQVTDRSSHSGAILIRDARNKLVSNITPAGEYRRGSGRMILAEGTYQIIDNGKSKNSATLIVDSK